MMTTYPIRKLDEASLSKLREMERKLGCCIVAIDPPQEPAILSRGDLKKLQNLEEDMNAILLAYACELADAPKREEVAKSWTGAT